MHHEAFSPSDGELTVGPVPTTLLRRGVEYGRVPDDCWVRASGSDWRNVHAVREIAALSSKVGPRLPNEEQLAEWTRPAARVRDEEDLAHHLSWLALVATGAESAMFHYRRPRSRRFITRSVVGPMSPEWMGRALPDWDPLLEAARLGRPVTGPPYGPIEDALALRMATSQGGVGAAAMIPIFWHGTLRGLLELSRPGHAFRREDLRTAERIAQRALARH
jgi:hypothetical protein